jgi:hypothetical protein
MAIGRPPKYDEEFRRAFGRAVDGGMTIQELARAFNLTPDTAGSWRRRLRPEVVPVRRTKPKQILEGDTDKPLCVCGGRLEFITNGNGQTLERCHSCGLTKPIALQGKRKHDQRDRLQRELDGVEDRAASMAKARPVAKKGNGNCHALFRRDAA